MLGLGTLTQPKIILISVGISAMCIGLFTATLILPWYRNDEEGDVTLWMAIYEGRANGMYLLASLAAMIGGAVVSATSISVFFLGDSCAAAVGLDWFASWIKNTMFRLCSTATSSATVCGLFCGFQCREKGESMRSGYFFILPILPISFFSTCLLYYYPFAPSGAKGLFDDASSEEDDDDSGGGADDDDASGGGGGWGMGSLGFSGLMGSGGKKKNDDDDDEESEDEESEESAPKKKKKGKR